MYPSTEDIFTIAYNVLDTMIHVEAVISDASPLDALTGELTGCIQISGAWQGAVILQSSERFARQAASQMLSLTEEDVTLADMQDVMAEITNMIGGNIKSQVPGPSYLSLPCVTAGNNFNFHLANSKAVNGVSIEVENESLCILLREAND